MKNELHKFQKYPLPQEKLSWLDKLRIKTHFGGIARCNVCGSLTILYVRGTTLRESCTCIRCHSWSRQRQVAYVVCQAISAVKQKSIHPIKDLARLDDLVIYNTEADRATHKQLAGMRNYIASEYFGSTHQSGEIVNNIVRQDLMNLSLKNESV